MSRRQRLYVPDGVYYVVQRGSAHQPIFSQPDDYPFFERLLAAALRRAGARVHAYCWTPDAIHLVLQIGEISVGRFMQGLTSRYARSMQKRAGESGHFFRQRYRAVLIDPAKYLLGLIRYLHYTPVLAGLADRPGDYMFSSHAAYSRSSAIAWLTTRAALRLLRHAGSDYAALISFAPPLHEIEQFVSGGANDARVIGGPDFLASLPRHSRTYRSTASLDQIIQTVTCTLGLERERVLSNSRERELTLARALIGWYAMERGVATLSDVARRLRRDPSTLSLAISRYRVCRSELFKLTSLHDVVPLARVDENAGWENGVAILKPPNDEDRKTA
ncbi:MAG: transposase [Steroidobacter sp.]